MEKNLAQYLSDREILIADGATGTMLMGAGLPAGTPPDLWNIEHPDKILALHRAYLDAGSKIILTNTFGATRLRLEKSGMGESVYKFNLAAAVLARGAAAGKAYVAGDIGPTGEFMAPLGKLTYDDAVEVFAEQASALADGGVDGIWVETMTDLEEVRAAIVGTRQVTDLPILCTMSFGPRGFTNMGVAAKVAARELWPLGLSAIGANCGEGVDVVGEVLKQMREELPDAPLIAKPNAGEPKLVDGLTVYDMEPGEFSMRIENFLELGACIIGACCGSKPDHISALDTMVQQR